MMRTCLTIIIVVASSVASVGAVQPRGELIERTLAIVGGRAVTLSDVRTATALELVEGKAAEDAAVERLVERALILREVDRYAPPEPSPQRIDEQVAAIRQRLGDARLQEVLAIGGFTPARLRAWIRDDLRIAAYIDQRFAAADVPVDQVAPELRERLSAERREGLIADWIADLRRRTPVVELWRQ